MPLVGAVRRLWPWPSAARAARREADAVIRRARDKSYEQQGNVYRPKALRKPKKLH
jgi:hypothetical protein